jgi:hypothetical protein
LFGPAVGFVGFGFPFCDGLDREATGRYFGIGGGKLIGVAGASGQGAVCFFVETGADCFDGGGEEIVVVGDGQGEAGFNCAELSDHFFSMRGVMCARRSSFAEAMEDRGGI